jgi:hypothetical protein
VTLILSPQTFSPLSLFSLFAFFTFNATFATIAKTSDALTRSNIACPVHHDQDQFGTFSTTIGRTECITLTLIVSKNGKIINRLPLGRHWNIGWKTFGFDMSRHNGQRHVGGTIVRGRPNYDKGSNNATISTTRSGHGTGYQGRFRIHYSHRKGTGIIIERHVSGHKRVGCASKAKRRSTESAQSLSTLNRTRTVISDSNAVIIGNCGRGTASRRRVDLNGRRTSDAGSLSILDNDIESADSGRIGSVIRDIKRDGCCSKWESRTTGRGASA